MMSVTARSASLLLACLTVFVVDVISLKMATEFYGCDVNRLTDRIGLQNLTAAKVLYVTATSKVLSDTHRSQVLVIKQTASDKFKARMTVNFGSEGQYCKSEGDKFTLDQTANRLDGKIKHSKRNNITIQRRIYSLDGFLENFLYLELLVNGREDKRRSYLYIVATDPSNPGVTPADAQPILDGMCGEGVASAACVLQKVPSDTSLPTGKCPKGSKKGPSTAARKSKKLQER